MSVIKLGGCNGSGKTSVARGLLDAMTKQKRHEYQLKSGKTGVFYRGRYDFTGVDVYVLGKYDNVCGGMDTISDKEDRFSMVQDLSESNPKAIVFFEGLITGKTFGALGDLSVAHQALNIPWLYAFMDTPFDVCVDRVLMRRARAGKADEPFDPERTMRPTFNSCTRLAQKLRNGTLPEFPVMLLPHKRGPKTLAQLLMNKAAEVHNGNAR